MMEPQYVFGAATAVGTRIQKSSQDTTPSADNTRNPKAEKNEKTALRGSLSLDKRGPHTCWAFAALTLHPYHSSWASRLASPIRNFSEHSCAFPVDTP